MSRDVDTQLQQTKRTANNLLFANLPVLQTRARAAISTAMPMTWQQGRNKQGLDKYYKTNGDWTLCVTGYEPNRKFGLTEKGQQTLWFDTEIEAKIYFDNLQTK